MNQAPERCSYDTIPNFYLSPRVLTNEHGELDRERMLLYAWFLAKENPEDHANDFCAHHQTWANCDLSGLLVVLNVMRLHAEGKTRPLVFDDSKRTE
jgi:hypothetical protein